MIRVLIADDHAVVRQGLRTFLALQDDMEVVADAADGEEAVRAAREHAPDIVLMDLVMPNMDGVEATRRIASERPATRVIALTSFLEDDKVLPAVRAGAASSSRGSAATPSRPGISRSSSTTSGRTRPAAAIAASPSAASPATSMSSCSSR